MSEPQISTPKGPRRSGRRPKPVPAAEEPTLSHISDVDSSAAPSAAEHTLDGVSPSTQKKQKNKKQPKTAKKITPDSGPDQATRPEANRSAQSNNVPNKAKATPIKAQQAYAGPTFHHSPAPSALPIPSFYSKSVPNVSTTRPPEAANDSGAPRAGERVAKDQYASHEDENEVRVERETTPLDFLFEAAKKAKGTPVGRSPEARLQSMSGYESPYDSKSPAPREGDQVFPFELESGRSTPGGIAPAFATPYKDRMDALRSTSSSVGAASDLDEAEAKAKSDALKKFMNLTPRAASVASDVPDPNNPFRARAPQPRNSHQPTPQQRNRSGPSTPISDLQNGTGPIQYSPNMQPTGHNGQNYTSPLHRPASSHLRHLYRPSVDSSPVELPSNGAHEPPLISTARKPSTQHETPRHIKGQFEAAQIPFEQGSQHNSKPSAQELEDQLRSILKLDGIASRG